jgi:hypothetical protein
VSNRAEDPEATRGEPDEEQRERSTVYGGWRTCETVGDVGEQERLVDRWVKRNPGMADQSDAEIARELLKMQRRSIERHGGARPSTRANIHTIV